MASAVLQYGFSELKLSAIYAIADPANHSALAVMERLGMRSLGPNRLYYQGEVGEVFVADRAHWTPPESALRPPQQGEGARDRQE